MDNFLTSTKRFHKASIIIYSSIIFARCIIIGILFYRYVIFSSAKEVKKWWTLVEAIYEPISYLPYRGDPKTNLSYQTILFHACSDGIFWGICDITTKDNKIYNVTMKDWYTWSDKKPMSRDDIVFTYQNIVITNTRQQPYLVQYSDIIITGDNNTLVFIFPFADTKNSDFFKLPILPKHILEDKDISSYLEEFAVNPINSTCAKLGDSNNEKNLIIDMTRCQQNNINYYQIKSFATYEELIKTSLWSNKISISLYKWQDALSWYRAIYALENTYMTMFFNTSSVRLSPRIQRAFWWLIHDTITKQWENNYFNPYTGLLAYHRSDGDNVKEYISSKNPLLDYDKQGLEKAGVKKLPNDFTVEWSNIRQAYYIEWPTDTKTYNIIMNTNEQFSNTQVRANTSKVWLSIKTTNDFRTHKIGITLWAEKNGIRDGVNTITIQWTQKWKLKTIATIDVYYLWSKDTSSTQKLKVIYYKDSLSNYTIELFKDLLVKNNIQDLFDIKWYNDLTEFAGAINGKIYDIVFTSLSMQNSSDIAAIITNDSTEKNPSSYKNLELAKKLEEYAQQPGSQLKWSIQDIFSNDMPFTILGRNKSQYRLKDTINFSSTGDINADELRSSLLSQSHIVSHLSFRAGKMLEKDNFNAFIQSEMQINQ